VKEAQFFSFEISINNICHFGEASTGFSLFYFLYDGTLLQIKSKDSQVKNTTSIIDIYFI